MWWVACTPQASSRKLNGNDQNIAAHLLFSKELHHPRLLLGQRGRGIPARLVQRALVGGAPVAAGLCAELCVHCKGDWVGKRGAEDQLVFEVEGRRELRLIVPLIAWSALPPTLSQAELQRRQAARDVAALR